VKTTKAQRRRIVQLLRLGVPLPERTCKAQRQRIVDVLRAEVGLPRKAWSRPPRGRPEPIDMTELDGIRAELETQARQRRALLAHLRLVEDRDLRIRCLACGDAVAYNPRGPVCASPRAIAGAHWYVCRGRTG
jgi:hypothetical protein